MEPPATPRSRSPDPPKCAKCAALRADVLQSLRRSGYPPLWNIDCQVDGKTIVLHGVVPTYHLKQVVQTLVLRMGKSRSVRNLIEVR